jgi:tRNA threonylcarbamoyladenosine biosynthesis protein TsaB
MLILSADTSGKHGSIALAQCETESCRAIEVVPLQGGTFSAQLVPQISQLLSKHHVSKSDIAAFAVASGPGSFTGLRVGLAAIKAFAEILRKPIAAVSLLEVIAFEVAKVNTSPKTIVALDAGRNETFVGEYSTSADLPVLIAESLLTCEELAQPASDSAVIYTPDETVVEQIGSRLSVKVVDRPNAFSVAQLGYKKLLAGQTVSAEALDATYIRRADAEIKKSPQKT